MRLLSRLNYWQRIFGAYLGKSSSHLTFWHEQPQVNSETAVNRLGQYYMTFTDKTLYPGPFDQGGVPLLNYHGRVGKQYNPIAIAQYGLGHYNLYKKNNSQKNLEIVIKQADWLVNNLEKNKQGVWVWLHHFDWEYRDKLKAPWYSALAQGNGISLLARVYQETKNERYLATAREAFQSFSRTVNAGGVLYLDRNGDAWLEEAVVEPPTHILNGFLWTLFGVWDYWLLTKDEGAKNLFDQCVKTLKNNLKNFDVSLWSLYEQSGTKMKMLASSFYHNLHIVQLKILYKITNEPIFKEFAEKWEKYKRNWLYRNLALIYKVIFKIFYY